MAYSGLAQKNVPWRETPAQQRRRHHLTALLGDDLAVSVQADERYRAMQRAHEAGLCTMAEIGRSYGVTGGRVSQLLRRAARERRHGPRLSRFFAALSWEEQRGLREMARRPLVRAALARMASMRGA